MADEQKNRTETGSKADLDRQIGRTWPDIFRYYSTAIFVTHLRISGLLGFALFFALLAVKLEGTSYRGLSFWIASVSAFVALLYAFRLTFSVARPLGRRSEVMSYLRRGLFRGHKPHFVVSRQ